MRIKQSLPIFSIDKRMHYKSNTFNYLKGSTVDYIKVTIELKKTYKIYFRVRSIV